jgi:MerR family transcriptional regulator, light-induced transcriptional regulator
VTEKSAGADQSTNDGAIRDAAKLSRLYLETLRGADTAGAYQVASRALERGMDLPALYQRVITPAMYEIGELWEKGAITVADEHAATTLTHRVLGGLRPPAPVRLDESGSPAGARAVLATVEGEQHALGVRMVADVLEEVGFCVICLGPDVPTEALLQSISTFSPSLLALSATMPELAPTLESVAARARREHPQLQVIVGGQALLASGAEASIPDLEALSEALVPPV